MSTQKNLFADGDIVWAKPSSFRFLKPADWWPAQICPFRFAKYPYISICLILH